VPQLMSKNLHPSSIVLTDALAIFFKMSLDLILVSLRRRTIAHSIIVIHVLLWYGVRDVGVRQNGREVEDVVLPPWARKPRKQIAIRCCHRILS
jgi:hypothetical protein